MPGLRIEHLSCCTYLDGEMSITSIAVIVRGHPSIYIFRYRTGELKLFQNFEINISKAKADSPTADVSSYPYESKFSKYGLHLAVALYDGSIQIYEIPEVTIVRPKQEDQKAVPKSPLSGAQSQSQSHLTYFATLDEPTVVIQDCQATIQFEGVPVEADYKTLLESLRKKEEKAPS